MSDRFASPLCMRSLALLGMTAGRGRLRRNDEVFRLGLGSKSSDRDSAVDDPGDGAMETR